MKTVSFVIPVFRNEGSLKPTHEQITALFKNELKDYDYDMVFVNDGSDDGSLDELLEIREMDPKVRVFSLSRNFGQREAVMCGFKQVRGDCVVKMSADLQEPIDTIPKMVHGWAEGNEVVICYRAGRNDSFFENTMSSIFYSLMNISNSKMPKSGYDFWLLGERAVTMLNSLTAKNRMLQGDILWMGYNVKFLPYQRLKREIGESQQSMGKKVKFFIDGLIYTSYLPIRVMSLIGFLFAFLGIISAVVVVVNRLVNENPYTGWASLIVLNLVIGGLIMLMLGMIGEYLWRIHDQTRARPDFIIDKIYDEKGERKA